MTARISRSFTFQAGVHFNNIFNMNLYQVDMDFDVESESIREQNIAVERIKYFLAECLEHSVMLFQEETDAIQKYVDADMKVCTLPEDPYDQIIGIMLMVKLNAIIEGRLLITNIGITSRMSDGVYCHHDIDENIGPFKDAGWWSDNSTKMNNVKPNRSKKVVKLAKPNVTWDDLFLGWDENNFSYTGPSSEIVFVEFDSKTDK
jgi:hypothetical protein